MTEFDLLAAQNYTSTTWESKRRAKLWIKQEGLCNWCHRETLMPWDPGYFRKNGALSGKAATLDHLHSRLSGHRSKSYQLDEFIMACATCNFKRNREEVNRLNRERMKSAESATRAPDLGTESS